MSGEMSWGWAAAAGCLAAGAANLWAVRRANAIKAGLSESDTFEGQK